MHMIPGKTKVKIELFKGITLTDILFGAFSIALLAFIVTSSIPGKLYIAGVLAIVIVFLFVRIDTEPNYVYVLHILRHYGYRRRYAKNVSDESLYTDRPNPASKEMLQKMLTDEKDEKPLTEKERKALRKEEDKILADKSVSQEEKDAVIARRKERIEKSIRIMAEEKDADLTRRNITEIMPFTGIENGLIEYGGEYFGAAIEIPPVEFRFFSPNRRETSIEQGLGKVLRSINPGYSANIVKLERPVYYDDYLHREYDKLDRVKSAYEKGLLTEMELQSRVEIIYDRIYELQSLCYKEKIVIPFYYIVLFEADKRQLEIEVENALNSLRSGEMNPRRLDDKGLAVFLKYSNSLDFDERDIEKIAPEDYCRWAMPSVVDIMPRRAEVNHIITHNFRIAGYPLSVGDAWLAGVFSMPGTKCVIKCRPMDRSKAVRAIDRSLEELREQFTATGVDSRRMELETHIDTLGELLSVLQQDNETLLETNIYVTAYDIALTQATPSMVQPGESSLSKISGMRKAVRRLYQESGMRLNNMEFDQVHAFVGSQISGWDPMLQEGRGIPSNSLAAGYPWIYSTVSDVGGVHLGSSDGVPVFVDFFRRDSERLNSNVVIVGKSGSGKSYATKSLLSNLAADDSKIFILDPENEYTELAANLSGKFINVGNAQQGRLNPFQIITALDDDESDGQTVSGSYATHLQFLEEFFVQILPDCDKDALEYLNSLVDRMYRDKGITAETDLSKLSPEDYPIFDDLYDIILLEFQKTGNDYIRSMLRVLMNYVAKFSTGGRNANIWNGPSTVTTEENFIVFNFQSLLANRNMTIANAQMLLVLKYVDNEIIKNRDYNKKYNLNRKVIVVIDEAHVFIDTKYPIALDFMFQLAKRIRKYNGMQIVITQNIKDFVGSEEIARKSTAIINACQYSLIFSLAPNDMQDLCTLYEKAGGINESEQEEIVAAPRGEAFTVLGPASRTMFKVEVPEGIADLFSNSDFVSAYFTGEEGEQAWEDFVAESRKKRIENGVKERAEETAEQDTASAEAEMPHSSVTFMEIEEEAPEAQPESAEAPKPVKMPEPPAPPAPPAKPAAAAERRPAEEPEETILLAGPEEAPELPRRQSYAAPEPKAQEPGMEKILADLADKFRYDAMKDEIRRAVRMEIEQEMAARRAAENAQAAPVNQTPASVPAAEPPAAPTSAAETPAAEAAVPEVSGPVLEGPSAHAAAEEPAGLDIAAVLAMQAQKLGDVSPIDVMETYGEMCVEVSLEELAKYNSRKK